MTINAFRELDETHTHLFIEHSIDGQVNLGYFLLFSKLSLKSIYKFA